MFCTIIGHPLLKPRSVKLWGNFFKKKRLNIKMFSKEIKPENFERDFSKLLSNKNFLASAVTMPYKKKVISKIIIEDKISKYSKSINFIIKKNKKIFGYNTDVYGALKTIKNFKKNNICIYGFGGSGEAIARVILKIYKKTKIKIISSKKKPSDLPSNRIKFFDRKKKINLSNIDLFINCSPLGSDLRKAYLNKSPLNLDELENANQQIKIFDIVYKPKKNLLNKLCKKKKIFYINGIFMNTVQAQIALDKVFKYYKKL